MMDEFNNREVEQVFNTYPKHIRVKMMRLRRLIMEMAEEVDGVESIDETLKWGEPAYVTRYGSTVRIDWKSSKPHQYVMYFHCKTKLIDTFRTLYDDKFEFDGNRAIVFDEKDRVPVEELKHCISLSLTYHKIKHRPLLGV
jgi:hypothetical protein